MHDLFRARETAQRVFGARTDDRLALPLLDIGRRQAVHRDRAETVALGKPQNAELGAADARGIVQHGLNTGSSSPGELEMTRSTSEVAVCCSSASESSRVRACTSSNSRTFSIAITAWSAKVWTSSICLSANGCGSLRVRTQHADGNSFPQHRHAEHRAYVANRRASGQSGYSGSACRSTTWTDLPADRHTANESCPLAGCGSRRMRSRCSGEKP